MDTLLFALNAILPIILLILLGYILKEKHFLEEEWFKKGNKLVFRIFLPCLLFTNVYGIQSFKEIDWSVVIYSEIGIVAVFLLGLLVVKLTIPDCRQKGVILQCVFRSNFAIIGLTLAESEIGIVAVFLLGLLVVKLTIPDCRQKGVILQCVFRSNFAIIGLTLAESLGGPAGVGIATILSAFSIPTFNILAVISLTMFVSSENGKKANLKDVLVKIAKNPLIIGVLSAFSIPTFNILAVISLTMFVSSENGKKANLKDVLVKIAKNPLIIGVVCGLICLTFNILAVISLTMFVSSENGKKANLKDVLVKIAKNPLIIGVVCGLICLGIRSLIPVNKSGNPVFSLSESLPFVYTAIKNVAKISSPLALIILGGMFDFSAVRGMLKQIIIGTAFRVAIVPFVVIGLAVILSRYTNIINFDATVYPSLIALFGSPVAVSSAIMAQEMDNDGVLAGQLVVWTSIASIFSLFISVLILRSIGLL